MLCIAGEKASASILGPQMKRVATDVKVIDLEGASETEMSPGGSKRKRKREG